MESLIEINAPEQDEIEKIKLNPIIKWIEWRINNNKNAIIIINGATGSGKSWSGIRLAYDLSRIFGTNFNIENNVDFNFGKLLQKIMRPENEKAGTCFVFEEVGVMGGGAASREWQSQANKFFFSFLQTNRCKRQVLIFTCPNFRYLDKGSRELVHLQLVMQKVDFKKKVSIIKPFLLQVGENTNKIYRKYLRFYDCGAKRKVTRLEVKCPPRNIVEEYEKMKNEYVNGLNQSILDASKPKTDKNTPQKLDILPHSRNKVVDLLRNSINPETNRRFTIPEISGLLNLDYNWVNNHLAYISKQKKAERLKNPQKIEEFNQNIDPTPIIKAFLGASDSQ